MARNHTPTLYCDDGSEIELPTKWAICPACNGDNRTTAHIEHDGGGITASEMDDLGDDFREAYVRGDYDRPCDECDGGKVKVADFSRMTRQQRRDYNAQIQDDREYEAVCAAERRMGA